MSKGNPANRTNKQTASSASSDMKTTRKLFLEGRNAHQQLQPTPSCCKDNPTVFFLLHVKNIVFLLTVDYWDWTFTQ